MGRGTGTVGWEVWCFLVIMMGGFRGVLCGVVLPRYENTRVCSSSASVCFCGCALNAGNVLYK